MRRVIDSDKLYDVTNPDRLFLISECLALLQKLGTVAFSKDTER